MTARFPTGVLTDNWVRALFAPALVFIATSVNHNYQTDLWHHLARGRAMWDRGALVNTDLFTFTVPGRSFQDANWLSQVVFYLFFRAGGLELVQLVNSLALSAAMGCLVWMAWRKSGSVRIAAILCVFAFFGLWQLLIIRPQTFSLLLFVTMYAALEAAARQPRWLLLPPFLMALWSNMHGGFPIGLLLTGCYMLAGAWDCWRDAGWAGLRDRHFVVLAACFAACILATMLNPYGWRVYQYVGLTSSVASARRIDEWLPPGLDQLVGKVWVLSILALLVLFALGQRPRTREVMLVLCFLPLACGSARMVSWWLLVSVPISARLLAGYRIMAWSADCNTAEGHGQETVPHQVTARFALGAALTLASLFLACVASLPWFADYNPALVLTQRNHRTETDLERIAAHLRGRSDGGRIFSRFEWGEYMGWALAPQHKVIVDGRIEIFPDEVWSDFTAVTRGRADWEPILHRYGVDYLLLDQSGFHADLLPQVEASSDWQRVYTAGDAVLYERRAGRPCVAVHDGTKK